MNLMQKIKTARARGIPVLTVTTPDSLVLEADLREGLNSKATILHWDSVRGIVPDGDEQRVMLEEVYTDLDMTINPVDALRLSLGLPDDCVLIMHMAGRWLAGEGVSQAIVNLREPFKSSKRLLMLMGDSISLPSELQNEVIPLDQALPSVDDIKGVVSDTVTAAGLEVKESAISCAAEKLKGLSLFAAEQTTALSLSKKSGISLDIVGERRNKSIDAVKGLRVVQPAVSFDDIGGLENAKRYAQLIADGSVKYQAIAFSDEIEKGLAGAGGGSGSRGGDSSGTSQDIHGRWLTAMNDNEWGGWLYVGCPGVGKSLLAQALAKQLGVDFLELDFNALKGSYVGESEAAVRLMIKTLLAIAGKQLLVVATCNRLESLSPELRSRFGLGTWFFDLPSDDERAPIWDIHLEKNGLSTDLEKPIDSEWSGREIANCCRTASRLKLSLIEASQYIVPVIKADPASVQEARGKAAGRFISASYPGVYKMAGGAGGSLKPVARKLEVE